MRIHLIAVGGSAMHNMALALHEIGHEVSGSDDEIYDPARGRLSKKGLLPENMGWDPARIISDIDAIILGMHARLDNPELKRAQELKIPIYSYPEYVYKESINKKRIVVAGSHGKTTTTAMILHVLNHHQINADYLVGAQLKGFDTMVRLSDAPIIILEGDEYLSSPLDRVPKIHFYKPHVTIITGIAWDHINVFPTFENYLEQFELYIGMIEKGGTLIYYTKDKHLQKMAKATTNPINIIDYDVPKYVVENYQTQLLLTDGKFPIKIFGVHNLENMTAARLACAEVGVSENQFYEAIQSFEGADKRLQCLSINDQTAVYLDFAHAPSKVEATIKAFRQQFQDRKLIACFELHTFSSLNKNFLKHYKDTMVLADEAVIYYSEHTLKMKKLPPISREEVAEAFAHHNIKVFTNKEDLLELLTNKSWKDQNLLLMTSGKFGGINTQELANQVAPKKGN